MSKLAFDKSTVLCTDEILFLVCVCNAIQALKITESTAHLSKGKCILAVCAVINLPDLQRFWPVLFRHLNEI